jgi:hypothetical protein
MDLIQRNAIQFETPKFQIEMNEWIRTASDQIREKDTVELE